MKWRGRESSSARARTRGRSPIEEANLGSFHILVVLALSLSGAERDTIRIPSPAGATDRGRPGEAPQDSVGAPAGYHESRPSTSPEGVGSAHFPPALDSLASRRRFDYLWVLRSAIVRPSSIDSVVARAKAIGVKGLLVQVVGRGDAYYRSSILPRAESLWADPDYDPLAEILARAHQAGLEVQAWMNCMLVWSAPTRPRDPRHVVVAHPEWVACLKNGRPLTHVREPERRREKLEGVFLTPAHPGVKAWLGSIAREIAERYDVDGIHLDYIRQPDARVGYDPTTRARFALETGVDPERFRDVPRNMRAKVDSAWIQFQRDQVTQTVRQVRDSVHSVRPGLELSAAVVADTARAERWDAQCWRQWLKEGLLDRAFLMCYAPSVQQVMDQLVAFSREFGTTDRLVPGIAVFNTSPAAAALKIKGARALGYPVLALYSYDSLFLNPINWAALRGQLETAGRNGEFPQELR